MGVFYLFLEKCSFQRDFCSFFAFAFFEVFVWANFLLSACQKRDSRACYGQRKLLYLQVHFKASQGQISRGNFRTFQPYFGRITTAEKSGNTARPITYQKKALPSLHSTIKPRKKFARFYCFFPLFVL